MNVSIWVKKYFALFYILCLHIQDMFRKALYTVLAFIFRGPFLILKQNSLQREFDSSHVVVKLTST